MSVLAPDIEGCTLSRQAKSTPGALEALDASMYTSVATRIEPANHTCDSSKKRCRQGHVRQYVKIIGARKNSRIALPLSGASRVSGNIRVVLDTGEDRAFVHVPYVLPILGTASGGEEAIDWGVTEVLTDSHGEARRRLRKAPGELYRTAQQDRQGQRQAPCGKKG